MNSNNAAIGAVAVAKRKAARIIDLDTITPKDIEDFDNLKRRQLGLAFTKKLMKLKGAERDKFIHHMDQVITADTKSDIWEYNHSVIGRAISGYMRKNSAMPAIGVIAAETGLSRQTVAKHFREYKRQPEFTTGMEQFTFMTPNVLTTVLKVALNGDMRAARLYLETVGTANKQPANTIINESNNNIQINNTILSQENLKRLTAEQLNQIESIVMKDGVKKISGG